MIRAIQAGRIGFGLFDAIPPPYRLGGLNFPKRAESFPIRMRLASYCWASCAFIIL